MNTDEFDKLRDKAMSSFLADEEAIREAHDRGRDWECTSIRRYVKRVQEGLFVTPPGYGGVITGPIATELADLQGQVFTEDELDANVRAVAGDKVEESRKNSAGRERDGQLAIHLSKELSWIGEHYDENRTPKEVCALIRKMLKQGVSEGKIPAPCDFRVSTVGNNDKWWTGREYRIRTFHSLSMVGEKLDELFAPYQKCSAIPHEDGYKDSRGGPFMLEHYAISLKVSSIETVSPREKEIRRKLRKGNDLSKEARKSLFDEAIAVSCRTEVDAMLKAGHTVEHIRENFSGMRDDDEKKAIMRYIDIAANA